MIIQNTRSVQKVSNHFSILRIVGLTLLINSLEGTLLRMLKQKLFYDIKKTLNKFLYNVTLTFIMAMHLPILDSIVSL